MADHEEPVVGRPGEASTTGAESGSEAAVAVVARVLAALPGPVVFLVPEYSPEGQVKDLGFAAASPGAVGADGRRGPELVGRGVLETCPGVAGTDLWHALLRAVATGTSCEEELEYEQAVPGVPHRSRYRVRAAPCEGGLIVSWNRLDRREREERRLAAMQRLGRVGWVDRDLTQGSITWSDGVYSIFGREETAGPLTLEELSAHADPQDRPGLEEAIRRLLKAGEAIDRTFRIHLPNGQVRHVRVVTEAETDAHGKPVQIHGVFQDLTSAKLAEQLLLEHERSALAHRTQLAAERELAERLQDTLLPVPQQTLHLAGLTVDVAYQPLQEGLNLGGDWYSAIELPDGKALFVVGDVAGHGLDAVATMALLRFTAKGMAITGMPLPTVLDRLNTLLLHTTGRETRTATMIMACYDRAASRLTWVRAGHLPPLLLRDGEARFLPCPGGIILGAVPTARYEAAGLDLRPGDHLLLYTDGLVENPREPIDHGMGRLARTAAAHADAPRLLDALVAGLVAPAGRNDDICAVHITR